MSIDFKLRPGLQRLPAKKEYRINRLKVRIEAAKKKPAMKP